MEIKREPFVWGKNDCIVKGEKIAILSYGTMLDICLKASEKLSEKSVSHAVYNMRFLKPIDEDGLNEIFSKFERIIVVEDHINTGGLSSIIREFAWENGKKNKIAFMNLRHSFFRPGNFSDAIQNTELTVGKIISKVMDS
jgi:1-deoxy-D-xylulose-5-phosphate synthase